LSLNNLHNSCNLQLNYGFISISSHNTKRAKCNNHKRSSYCKIIF
jgi:hypothetical protein